MKKIYVLLAFLLTGTFMKAQDTLLFEDFELDNFYTNILIDGSAPLGLAVDTNWYSWDSDGTPDGSAAGTRPDGWFAVQPFSTVDQYETQYSAPGTPDTNTVISANTWTNTSIPESNWLSTKNVLLGTHDTLFWKSAPFQTPRYLDGYQVLLSTSTNADNTSASAFANVLFNAQEMTALGTDSTFSTFTFANTGAGGPAGFVHGLDGNNIDFAGTTAPMSHRGQLRQFSLPLDAYANANVFIAFLSNSTDDNLISLDDVMIRGNKNNVGIQENSNDLGVAVFPNPATDNVQINYTLTSETVVTINVFDVTGKLVASVSNGAQAQGFHFAHINTSDLAKGFYTVNVKTATASSNTKLIVR